MKNQKNGAVTVTDTKRLIQLAQEIKTTYAASNKLALTAKEKGAQAIAEAVLCGKALIEAKSIVGHGNWYSWLKKNCKIIGPSTATKYMRLSNRDHGHDLEDATTLRQAYLCAGIISTGKVVETAPERGPESVKLIADRRPDLIDVATVDPEPNEAQTRTVGTMKPMDPMPMIRAGVSDLIGLLASIDKKHVPALLKPLRPWMRIRAAKRRSQK